MRNPAWSESGAGATETAVTNASDVGGMTVSNDTEGTDGEPVETDGLPTGGETDGGTMTADDGTICAAWEHACQVREGSLWCWGGNRFGQLGQGTFVGSHAPVHVALPGDVLHVDCQRWTTCAVIDGGEVYCWGANLSGAVGFQGATEVPEPMLVVGVTDAVGVAVGGVHACAWTESGRPHCWGTNDHGASGTNSAGAHRFEALESVLEEVRAIELGHEHGCALNVDGGVACWGKKVDSQVGVETDQQDVLMPRLLDLPPLATLHSAKDTTCALDTEQRPWCWGERHNSQFVADTRRALPTLQTVDVPVASVGVGRTHVCLQSQDRVQCAGINHYGQLGRMNPTVSPGVRHMVAGQYFNCIVDADGEPWCSGEGMRGQLGRDPIQVSTPATVDTLTGFEDIAAGSFTTCGRTESGALWCWGSNAFGELGDGSRTLRATPVLAASNVASVQTASLGFNHSCVVDFYGHVWCWGSSWSGQVGHGDFSDRLAPVMVLDETHAVAAGDYHTCAIRGADLRVWCWGANWDGALGIGEDVPSPIPTPVATDLESIIELVSGEHHSCALDSFGQVYCWGGY